MDPINRGRLLEHLGVHVRTSASISLCVGMFGPENAAEFFGKVCDGFLETIVDAAEEMRKSPQHAEMIARLNAMGLDHKDIGENVNEISQVINAQKRLIIQSIMSAGEPG